MLRFDNVLGVVGQAKEKEKLPERAEELIRKREDERKAGHWKEADKIREELKAMGVIIEDTAQGVKWRIEKH
jgi:cysteinyl-tRNA synthetase